MPDWIYDTQSQGSSPERAAIIDKLNINTAPPKVGERKNSFTLKPLLND